MLRSALLLLVVGLATSPAIAEREPAAGPTDPRVRTVVYNPRDVVHVLGHYGYQTLVRFGDSEQIENISIGDSLAWQVVPNERGNLLFVKPVEENADTNLTVVTGRTSAGGDSQQRIYVFSLTAKESDHHRSQDFTWTVQFHYPEDDIALVERKFTQPSPKDSPLKRDEVSVDPADWNFNYSFAGAKDQVPVKIFDNGTFTYFEFDEVTDTPAIFLVDDEQNESLVNGVRQGKYVVVHRTGPQFTLRNGNTVTCIFNDSFQGEPELDQGSPVQRDAKLTLPSDETQADAMT